MSNQDAKQNQYVVEQLYEQAINQGRLEILDALVAKDYVGANGERGPTGFADTVKQLRAGIGGLKFKLEELVASGDRVAVRWTWSGTHTGPLFGNPPSNKFITNAGIAIYRLRDGKVVAASVMTDRLGVLQQIGVVPPNLGRRPPQAQPQTQAE